MKNEVLIVATEFPPGPGGIGSHAFSLSKALNANGIDVTVVTCADYVTSQQAEEFDASLPFKVIRYPQKGSLKYLQRLFIVSRNLKRNVIFSGKFSLWTILWVKLTLHRVNKICILHGSEVNLQNFFLRLITHLAILSSNKIVSVSEFTKNLLPRWLFNHRQIEIVPNGINLDSFTSIDSAFSLNRNPVLLTVGNVTPRKGQHRVIKAMPNILKHYPSAHYHIVGLPTYQNEFSALAKKLDVAGAVTFHGLVPNFSDLFKYYVAADVFMILSENQKDGDCEGFGIVVLEAGYFQLPTVGAKGCGVADAIKDDYNGYLVDGDDENAICEAIAKVMSNKSRLQSDAKKWAEQHDWNVIVKDIIRLLK